MNFDHDITEEQEPQPDFSSGNLLWLSISSAVIYLLLALLIFHFLHESGFDNVLNSSFSVSVQLLIGLLAGCLTSAIIGLIISYPPVSGVLHDFYLVKMLSKAEFTAFDRLQLSFFAGMGEELLFRGAVQPLIGIWLTSVIFIGLHGYFKFTTVGHFLFSGMMFGLSVALGYIFEYAGLIAAMSAHATYDIIMLQLVQQKNGLLKK